MRRPVMVEVAGLEPASESISTGFSPSAASVLRFALTPARKQADVSAIPLVPYAAGITHKVFLHV